MGRLWKALHEIFIISGFTQVLLTKFKIAGLLSSAATEAVFLFICLVSVKQHMGSSFLEQGLNLCPLHWKHRVVVCFFLRFFDMEYF